MKSPGGRDIGEMARTVIEVERVVITASAAEVDVDGSVAVEVGKAHASEEMGARKHRVIGRGQGERYSRFIRDVREENVACEGLPGGCACDEEYTTGTVSAIARESNAIGTQLSAPQEEVRVVEAKIVWLKVSNKHSNQVCKTIHTIDGKAVE